MRCRRSHPLFEVTIISGSIHVKMVRFQSIAFLVGLAIYSHNVDAFVPSAASKPPTRIYSPLWYLDPSDLPMSNYGGLVVYGNATAAPIAPCLPQPESASAAKGQELDDMDNFESSFQGLSAPTQAGLGLSVLLTAAMMVASPAVDTALLSFEWDALSHLVTNGMPTSWLAQFQQDALPLLNHKLDLVVSGLSPKAEAVLEQARMQSMNFQSEMGAATQQVQASLNEFMDVAKGKSTEWHDILTAQASRMEVQSLSITQQMETAAVTRVAEAEAIYDQVQASVNVQSEEIRNVVLPKIEHAMTETKQSLSTFQTIVDEKLLKEGPVVRDEVDRYVLTPIRMEMAREDDLWKASALTTSSQIQAIWETTSSQFENTLLKMSQNMVDFVAESKVAISDGSAWLKDSVRTASTKLVHGFSSMAKELRDTGMHKGQEFQSQSVSAVEQFEAAAAWHIADARSMYAQINDDAAKGASEATHNIGLQAISRSSTDIQSSVAGRLEQIQNTMFLPLEQSLEDLKQTLDLFQKDTDTKMLEDGPVLRAEFDLHVLSPMVEGMNAASETVALEVARETAVLKDGASTTIANLQALWESTFAGFESTIHLMSQNMVDFYGDSKAAMAEEALKLQNFVNSKTIESRDVHVIQQQQTAPLLENVKAAVSSATSNLHHSIPMPQPQEGASVHTVDFVKSRSEYIRDGTPKLPDLYKNDAAVSFIRASVEDPTQELTSAETVISESLPSQYDRLQERLMNSI